MLTVIHFSLKIKTFYILFGKNKITIGQQFFAFPKIGTHVHLCSWSFTASNSLMHSIYRCTWKSLQFFIIIIMMATFMCVLKACISSKYSKCIGASKRILYTTAMYIFSSFFVYFSLLRYILSLALCMWE